MSLPPDEQLANRIFLAQRDMDSTREYLWGLQELEAAVTEGTSSHLLRAMEAAYVGAIVVYARPFVRSNSAGMAPAKLDPAALGLWTAAPQMEAVHAQVMTVRSQLAAHADWVNHATKLEPGNQPMFIIRRNTRINYRERLDFAQFLALAEYMHQALWQMNLKADSNLLGGTLQSLIPPSLPPYEGV